MSFDGLRGLLKKAKHHDPGQERERAQTSSRAEEALLPPDDLYQSVLSRCASGPTERTSEPTSPPLEGTPSLATHAKRPRSDDLGEAEADPLHGVEGGSESVARPLKPKTEFAVWQSRSIQALRAVLRSAAPSSPTPSLPPPVAKFLQKCIDDELPDTGDTEEGLLTDLAAMNGTASPMGTVAEATADKGLSTQQKRRQLLAASWFLVAAGWKAAITGDLQSAYHVDSAGDRIEGFTYPVYQFLRTKTIAREHELLADAIAAAAADWGVHQRLRCQGFHLLACLYHDYMANGGTGTSERCVIPEELLDGMHRVIVVRLQGEGDPAAARQAYTDLTFGNANWKLGLFSGGEVHMRRSMERVERNRIYHILQNERAVRLLHALRAWISLYEQHFNKKTRTLFSGKEISKA